MNILISLVISFALQTPDQAILIPLETIWATSMPGTKPLGAKLRNGKYTNEEGPYVDGISEQIRSATKQEIEKGNPGFAVQGTGIVALKNALSLMKEGNKEQIPLNSESDVSVMFYSFKSSRYVHIQSVEKKGRIITVKYKFVPHRSRDITHHFALIPITNLEEGTYEVKIERLPMDKKHAAAGRSAFPQEANKLVCESFKFTIREKPES